MLFVSAEQEGQQFCPCARHVVSVEAAALCFLLLSCGFRKVSAGQISALKMLLCAERFTAFAVGAHGRFCSLQVHIQLQRSGYCMSFGA